MSTIQEGQMEGVVVSAFLSGILLVQSYIYSKNSWGKTARTWIFIQFCLASIRGITVTFLNAFPWVNCFWLSAIGLFVFHLWIVALQVILYYRAWAFSVKKWTRRILTLICLLLWATILGFRFYQLFNTRVISKEGEFCRTISVGLNVATVNFSLLIVAYFILLLPFVHRAMYSYFQSVGNPEEAHKWLRLSLINIFCVLFIVFLEFFARYIMPMFPNYRSYNGILFSVNNFLQANIVLFLMEDLKKQLLPGTHSYPYSHQDKQSGSSRHYF
jgi:hypothetical protein